MKKLVHFKIESKGVVSGCFKQLGINNFNAASQFIATLPYRRNENKNNICCVLDEMCGTCSTKHATLRKLALENNRPQIKLVLGIFKMDAAYEHRIKNTLQKYSLNYMPEAHNYLKYEDCYLDFTRPDSSYLNLKNKLFTETEIEYDEVAEQKTKIHKEFLAGWLEKGNIRYGLDEIWEIREECIAAMQKEI